MEFVYRVFPERKAAFIHIGGHVSGEELEPAVRSFYEKCEWGPGFTVLWDTQAIRSLGLSLDEAKGLSAYLKDLVERTQGSRVAGVVTKDMYVHAIHLILTLSGWHDRTRLFRDVEKAAAWLGLPLPWSASVLKELASEAARAL